MALDKHHLGILGKERWKEGEWRGKSSSELPALEDNLDTHCLQLQWVAHWSADHKQLRDFFASVSG